MLVRLVLLGFGLGGSHPLRLVPMPAEPLEAHVLPRRLARWIELQDPIQVGSCFLLQIVLLAPEGQFPLVLGAIGVLTRRCR